VLLVDASRPWGNGRTLPAGPMREPVDAAARADVIVVTRADAHPESAAAVTAALRAAHPKIPVFSARHAPTTLVRSGACARNASRKARVARFRGRETPRPSKRPWPI
jgi:tetraacyldisaccharide-1-P 4'-kinase